MPRPRWPDSTNSVSEIPGTLHDLRQPPEARELRGQLEILGDEALIFALAQQADLPPRVDVALFRERHHDAAHLIITDDPRQAKSA